MRWNALAAAALGVAVLAGSAHAGITYTYVTDASNYTAAAGGTVTVNVYLDETLTGGSAGLIGPTGTEKGEFSADIAANLVSGGGTITGAAGNSNAQTAAFSSSNPQSGPGFGTSNANQTNVDPTTSTAAIYDQINFGQPNPKAYTLSSTGVTVVNQLFLGSFTINAGSAGTSNYTITSFNNSANPLATSLGDATVTSPNSNVLDQDGQDPGSGQTFFGTEDTPTTFTVTVAAVPEPNSMLLCLVGAPAAGLGVWMRRRKTMIAQA